jgi:muramoyltetrapeptide carboxypeptidase
VTIRYPAPLRPGDTVGVTASSSGVGDDLRPRLDHNVTWLRQRGYEVWVGDCLGDDRIVSAPKEQRAAELTAMLRDPSVRAVVPPWGGELAIDLLDQLDWDELATLEPTWLVGYSDLCSLMLPVTTLLGWATLHGTNLMDTAYRQPEGLRHWTDLVSGPGPFHQVSPNRHRVGSWDDYRADPAVEELTLDGAGAWEVVGGGGLDLTGRLVGGCLEVVSMLAATPYGDVPGFGRRGPTHRREVAALAAAGGLVRRGQRRPRGSDPGARRRPADPARGRARRPRLARPAACPWGRHRPHAALDAAGHRRLGPRGGGGRPGRGDPDPRLTLD